MNILKKNQKKENTDNKLIIKKSDNLSIIESSISLSQEGFDDFRYNNKLAWWNCLPDDWKRLLLSPNSYYELDTDVDISILPTVDFLDNFFNLEVFCSQWIPIDTLKPINAMKRLKTLSIESIGIKDFKEVSNIKNITIIHAGFSKLESLDGLENFESLEQISLVNTDVTSLKPIASLENINILDIRGTLINPFEYELFQQLHPSTKIHFITPMNPLRRSKESLENALLDYYKELAKSMK